MLFWLLPDRARMSLLILASLVFYASWSIPFLFHLLAVVAINYAIMELWRRYRQNWMFYLLQTANILNIACFKYFYFFADALGFVFGVSVWREPTLRLADRLDGSEIFLPLAISFYTFQIMSYGIDIFRGEYTRRHSFREVLLFKSFFPQLIAGPIMRSHELLPQVRALGEGNGPRPDGPRMRKGLWLVMIGVFKKVVVASVLLAYIAPIVNREADPTNFHPGMIWLAIVGCLFMLYADFSAYSDMARGFGALLGFEIPENFRAPFFMTSISDYWRRWHLTFSRWIRDYIYIPLGGSRVGEWRVYLNYLITFFIAGLWHGASYTFVVWGIVVGIMLSVESYIRRRGFEEWPKTWPLRFARLGLAWLFLIPSSLLFFAPNWDWALTALAHMFNPLAYFSGAYQTLPHTESFLGGSLGVLLFHFIEERPASFRWIRRYETWLLPLGGLVLIVFLTQFSGKAQDFFYFQF